LQEKNVWNEREICVYMQQQINIDYLKIIFTMISIVIPAKPKLNDYGISEDEIAKIECFVIKPTKRGVKEADGMRGDGRPLKILHPLS